MTLTLDPLAYLLTTGFHITVSRLVFLKIGVRFAFFGLAFCIFTALALAAIGGGILAGFHKTLPWRGGDVAAIPGTYYFAILVSWVSVYAWMMSWSKTRAAETRRILAENNATRAELHRLRTQLDPHFLYNTLNTIAAEIHDNPEGALEMTRSTAAFLRHNLQQHHHPVCSLAEEVESLRTYLRIQEGRFEVPFRMRLEVAEAAAQHPLPRWTLQALVENAFKHGCTQDLNLRISAWFDDGNLVLKVQNKGQLVAGKTDTGIGLVNLRRRLDLHFPYRHRIQLRSDKDDVVVELALSGEPCFA
jgi:LytS/YehU family sensor histidine kinase